VILLCVHVIVTIFRVARPGGARSVLAESVLLKHQLLILNRSRRRAPNLHVWDRFIAGLCSLLVKPSRMARAAVETRNLIRSISRDNPLWGSPRIHGELLKLGINVSQASVAKYMVRPRKPPSQTWRTLSSGRPSLQVGLKTGRKRWLLPIASFKNCLEDAF